MEADPKMVALRLMGKIPACAYCAHLTVEEGCHIVCLRQGGRPVSGSGFCRHFELYVSCRNEYSHSSV